MSVASPPAQPLRPPAKFTTGSLIRHILVMTGTGAIGLVAIFAGDFANILFLSWLQDVAVVAAVGYGSSVLFFTISIGIGLSIAASALVSPAIGAGNTGRARRLSTNAHLSSFAVSVIAAILVWIAIPPILTLLGATGRAHDLASTYLRILVPSTPFLSSAMTSAAVMRSAGDARRAMNVTLSIAVINTVLDLVLIYWAGYGVEGAAVASFIARAVAMGVGFYGVIHVHDLMARPKMPSFVADIPILAGIAIPAILTNIASPVSNGYVTAAISEHGDGAVAGWTIIGRIVPLAFGAIYALSGSIGPILGQNFGAGESNRLRRAFTLTLLVNLGFTLAAWALLAIFAIPLTRLMHATGEAADLVVMYCRWIAPLFVFMGALFVSNAAFNTLGRPRVSTVLNWGRATLGTVVPVKLAGAYAGAAGILWGFMLGGIVFGAIAVWLCYRMIGQLSVNMGPSGRAAPGSRL
ncbi:MAG: MATE family efflux transporter [Hyphomicrobium sp.]